MFNPFVKFFCKLSNIELVVNNKVRDLEQIVGSTWTTAAITIT